MRRISLITIATLLACALTTWVARRVPSEAVGVLTPQSEARDEVSVVASPSVEERASLGSDPTDGSSAPIVAEASLVNDSATRDRLRSEGATEMELDMMFLPAKLERYRTIIAEYRAKGRRNELEASIQGALTVAIRARLELLGRANLYEDDDLGDVLRQDHLVTFHHNGKTIVFERNEFPAYHAFQVLRKETGSESVLTATAFYDQLEGLLDETAMEALRFTGNRRLEYARPWPGDG